MGWYDAYRPTNVSRVNVAQMSSNSGNAARGLGDAFTKIGNSMLKVDKARDDEKTNKFINAYRDAQTTGVQKSNDAFDTTNALKNKKIDADTGYTTVNTGLVKKKVGVFDENNQASLNSTKAKTAYQQKQTDSYDKLLESKIAKNVSGTIDDGEKQKRAKWSYFNKVSKSLVPKTIDENGITTQDENRVTFLTNYMNDNYDPAKHKNYKKIEEEANQAFDKLEQQTRAKDAPLTIKDMPNYDKLDDEQKSLATQYYIKNGEYAPVTVDKHIFGKNNYSLNIPKQDMPKKDIPQEKKSNKATDDLSSLRKEMGL